MRRIGLEPLVVVALALGVRLLHLFALRDTPIARYLLIDSAFYDAVGRRLAAGDGFPEGVFFMNVLYGAFLGVTYWLGGSPELGRSATLALQALLGAASCGLVWLIGREIGRPLEGRVAAILLALLGPAIFYDAALLTPSVLTFLTTLAVWLAIRGGERPTGTRGLLLGLVLGLLVLGRANHLLLAALWFAWWFRRPGARPAACLLLVGVALVVAPVTWRNYREASEFVLVTANGGMALWAGNHEGATGIYSTPPFLTNPVPEREAEDYRAEASRRAGEELTLAASSSFWRRETVARWAGDPIGAARLAARKAYLWFHATESQTNLSYYLAIDYSWVLRAFRLHFGWVAPFVLLGAWPVLRRSPALWGPVVVSLITVMAFYMSSEYRQPVVPLLLLAAAGGVRLAVQVLRRGAWPAKAAVGVAIVALLVAANYRDAFLDRLQSRRVDYLNFATLAADAGELVEAEQLVRRSIEIDPNWPVSRGRLAEILQRTGRSAEAGDQLRATPGGTGLSSPEEQELWRATEWFRDGRFAEAQARFLEIADRGGVARPGALNNAGLCAMRLGEPTRAESLFVAARESDSTYASPVVHLGRLALSRADSVAARGYAEEALRLEPSDGRARRLLRRATGRAPGPEGGAP